MTGYFEKRKKRKLYQQWVDKSELPPESVPVGIERKSDSGEVMGRDDGISQPGIQSIFFHLTMRHILYLLFIIAVLLITTSVLSTILIMRSC
jgi:hypothetical protein